jgi:nucleoid DNA-binding protein
MNSVEDEIITIARKIFPSIAKEVMAGGTVIVKNFGTFALKKRNPRRRYDQGSKKVVETDPKLIIEFTQSPNVFRDENEKE